MTQQAKVSRIPTSNAGDFTALGNDFAMVISESVLARETDELLNLNFWHDPLRAHLEPRIDPFLRVIESVLTLLEY